MTSRRIAYLCILTGCLVFYFCYPLWMSWILLLTVLIFPWVSLILSLPAMIQFRGEIEVPPAVAMGETVRAELWGLSHLPQPRFLGRLLREDLRTGEILRYHPKYPLPTHHCGGIRLVVKRLRICDYLGLFTLPVRRAFPRVLVVRPHPVAMESMPDLSRCVPRAWKPKHGGGFAENHELRLYRPGDCLNQVHWKLSAKTGQLILREPMEPIVDRLVLTMDLVGTPEQLDVTFGKMLWLSGKLLEQNLEHEIRCLTGDGIIIHPVSNENQLTSALDDLLCRPAAPGGTIRDRAAGTVWQYHVGGDGCEA